MKTTSKVPFLLSAFVCPGAGQFMQRRWLAGSFFMAGFLGGFSWVMFAALRIIAAYYSMAFDIDAEMPDNIESTALIPPLILAVVFYVLNLFDMAAQNNRAARAKREEAFLQTILPATEAGHKKSDLSPQPPAIPKYETSG